MNRIEQLRRMPRQANRVSSRCARSVGLSALVALVAFLGVAPTIAAAPLTGLVTLADGEPFTLIRDYHLLTGTKGAVLNSGDIIETDAKNLMFIEFQNNAVIGVGPSSRLYLLPRADTATLVLLRGWIKADIHSRASPNLFSVLGPRLGASTRGGTFVMRVKDTGDELFHEDGAMTLVIREEGRSGVPRETKVNQYLVREGRGAVTAQPRPAAQFVDGLPVAFRDPLPAALSERLKGRTVEPKAVREVSYDDVQAWLAMPRDWRSGFVTRFRPRLRDATFCSAVDAHMANHPEWYPILHPPPPPEDNPEAAAAAAAASARPHCY
jgi:hypothetical protein